MDTAHTTHLAGARVDAAGGHGYVWRPVCSCGWTYPRRYMSEQAARIMSDDHAASTKD